MVYIRVSGELKTSLQTALGEGTLLTLMSPTGCISFPALKTALLKCPVDVQERIAPMITYSQIVLTVDHAEMLRVDYPHPSNALNPKRPRRSEKDSDSRKNREKYARSPGERPKQRPLEMPRSDNTRRV